MKPTWLLGCCLLSQWLGLTTASAHAPPLGSRVLSAANGEQAIITNRGVVFREAQTNGGELLCNEALGIGTADKAHATLFPDGSLLVASTSGLRLSRDRGCSWLNIGKTEMGATSVPALARFPDDNESVIVATYDGDTPGLYKTTDGGATWSLMFATGEGDYVHSLLVGTADSSQLYASVTTYADGAEPSHSLLRSRDGGAEWQRIPLSLDDEDYQAVVAATAPTDATTLVVYSVTNSPGLFESRLMVSRDGGDSFDVAFKDGEIRDTSFDSNGRLWVAARDALYVSNTELGEFEKTSSAAELGCVFETDGAIAVCGHYRGAGVAEFGVGISPDDGQTFEPWLEYSLVGSPVDCPDDSQSRAICALPWTDWEAEMLSGAPPGSPLGEEPDSADSDSQTPESESESESIAEVLRGYSEGDSPQREESAGCTMGASWGRNPSPLKGGALVTLLAALVVGRSPRKWPRKKQL